jgi:hypothetical protein
MQTISDSSLETSQFFSSKFANIGQTGFFINNTTKEQIDLYNSLSTSLDYPIRGGGLEFNIGQQTFTLSSKIDKTRIARFLKDARGKAFIQKQIGLQLSNPKMETGNTLFGLGQDSPLPGILENTRVYNGGINTLAQVGVSGTGVHALRHGLVPFAPFQKHYYDIVNKQNVLGGAEGSKQNRLVNLYALKMTTGTSQFVNSNNVYDINTVNKLGISLNRNLLFQYLGGPGSTYGIGATTISRAVDTTKLGVTEKRWASRNAMVYNQLKEQNLNKEVNGYRTTNIQDFRSGSINTTGSWTDNQTRDYRFNIKNPNGVGQIDKLNALYPFLFTNDKAPWDEDSSNTYDLIKFVFEAVSNDDTSLSTAIFFRAFLTAGITDNNSSKLNPVNYMGRGETFYTYQGFDRSIGFSFRVAAQSRQELVPMYNRINALMSQVYPDYSAKGFMRAPLVKITIGDYLYRMPGFLESVNITVDNGTPWEINLDNDLAQLPQVVDISVSFKPILDELPKRLTTGKFNMTSDEIYLNENNDSATVSQNFKAQGAVPQLIANNNKFLAKQIELLKNTKRQATNNEFKNYIQSTQNNKFREESGN